MSFIKKFIFLSSIFSSFGAISSEFYIYQTDDLFLSKENTDFAYYEENYDINGIKLFDPPSGVDSEKLIKNTSLVMVMGGTILGILYMMPESFTNWDTDDPRSPGEKWWDNVSDGPVWDEDAWHLNYIGHTYFGGVYYVVARDAGYEQFDSFLYSFLMSTFYWEYGIEAFAEIPSTQDLIITPVGGWIYGEWAYRRKKVIVANNSEVMGSKFLGSTSLFLLDPVNSIADAFSLNDKTTKVGFDLKVDYYEDPNQDLRYYQGLYSGLSLSYKF